MRRLLTVAALAAALVLLILLARAAEGWHYVVSGAPGTLLYATSFDEGDDWQTYAGRLDASVSDGALRLENGQVDSYSFSVARQQYGDIDLRARAQATSGPLNNGYGLLFRYRDPRNFYAFLVSSDGYYSVVRVVNGDQRWLSNWINSALVNQGIEAQNRLRVVGVGDTFRFLVNDTPVQVCIPNDPNAESTYMMDTCIEGTMQDTLRDSALASGQIGVVTLTFGEPDVVAQFDDVVIYSPETNG